MAREHELGSVLVATDFSEGARRALERAALLPFEPGASIDVVHVAGDEPESDAAVLPRLEQARQTIVGALRAAGNADHDVVVSSQHGNPFLEIARCAQYDHAELVVLGRRGAWSLYDRVLGTTAERVIRNADTSVLVVVTLPEGPYRRPLVTVDLSESSRLALELASRLSADRETDTVDVLHVLEPWAPVDPSKAMLLSALLNFRAEIERRARNELTSFLNGIDSARDARWNVIIRIGDPRSVILEEAERRNTDLLVLGAKGRTVPTPRLIGSVAQNVVRAAPCDVLLVRQSKADSRVSSGHAPRKGSGSIEV